MVLTRATLWEWWRWNPGRTEFHREQEERDRTMKTNNSFQGKRKILERKEVEGWLRGWRVMWDQDRVFVFKMVGNSCANMSL